MQDLTKPTYPTSPPPLIFLLFSTHPWPSLSLFHFLSFSTSTHTLSPTLVQLSLTPDFLSTSPENPLLQSSIIILRKSTFHQEQDWESIEVRIDEIKLGILIWEFDLWVLLMEVAGFLCLYVGLLMDLIFFLVHEYMCDHGWFLSFWWRIPSVSVFCREQKVVWNSGIFVKSNLGNSLLKIDLLCLV